MIDSERERVAEISAFLKGRLPPSTRREAAHFAEAIVRAGLDYDRHMRDKEAWWLYKKRRNILLDLKNHAEKLAVLLLSLDSVTRDELATVYRENSHELLDTQKQLALVGLLIQLQVKANDVEQRIQRKGTPRNVAEEKWIIEVADIFENGFRRAPRLWGSGASREGRRGPFYDLLMLSRPKSFARYGKLDPRQVGRVLKRRSARAS